MKARQLVSSVWIVAAVLFCSCGNNKANPENIKPVDSPSIDSTMPAHVQDPSTAFPQPPVTGTQTDSSRTTDSLKKKKDSANKR